MPIKIIRIHPGIGIARLGNSPDFFIGPLKPGDHTPPSGGYKDALCRVKRQAAEFRLYAYDENDDLVKEITAADGTINWTVRLVNRKAAAPDGFPAGSGPRNPGITNPTDRQKLVIDPGARSISGPNQTARFDNGTFTLPGPFTATVPLGEIRTDNSGHLLVLGGAGKSASPNSTAINTLFNNINWYDDTSDGSVAATVKIGADTFTAITAWVIVAPPKYAPPIDNPITLWDRLLQFFIDNVMLPPFNDPSPSYVKYIFPIIEAARQVHGVVEVGSVHLWTHPVIDTPTRLHIFNKLNPPGNMPLLQGGAKLTLTQHAIMQKWRDGNFTNDWPPPPPPADVSPGGLDEAALRNCVGDAFWPGIEAGDFTIGDKTRYLSPFRFDPAKVNPGDVTAQMSLPWQTDFFACATNWWPPERPNRVVPSGQSTYADWARGVGGGPDMVSKWSTLGFIVDQGGNYREVERCPSAFINLLTPVLNFKDVPQAPMGMSRKSALAIVFEVESDVAVTLEYVSGPTHVRLQRIAGNSATVGPTAGLIVHARLWITYETGQVGEVLNDMAIVREPVSGQEWTIQITANTVARKKAAAALVLDRSGSMIENRGDGPSKIQSLREATSIFVEAMLQEDAVALVRFNQDAQVLQGVTPLGSPSDPFDPGRSSTKNIIASNQLDPAGQTSIGDGIFEGRNALNAAAGFDVNSLVVLTDGMENSPRFIADVAGSINEFTYAIGLGKPENISVGALQSISGNNGGYLLVTGAISGDNRFLLQKYFLQILAGISNAEIVLDPQGELHPREVVRIPFQLTEADAGVDVILLSPRPQEIDFRVQTPSGYVLGPFEARTHSGVQYVTSNGITYYRMRLPFEYAPDRFDDRGSWLALLRIGRQSEPVPGSTPSVLDNPLLDLVRRIPPPSEQSPAAAVPSSSFAFVRAAAADTASIRQISLPYSVIVHTYSDIRLRAYAYQSSLQPGARVEIHAAITEYEIPLANNVQLWADVLRPGGGTTRVELGRQGEAFEGAFTASQAGVYRIRVQGAGRSSAGWPFRREITLTAQVFYGEGRPPDGTDGGRGGGNLCSLIECLIKSGVLTAEYMRKLREQGVDVERLIECLKSLCEKRGLNSELEDH